MAETIEEFAAERKIKWLFHFTQATNLPSILEDGLVTRDKLVLEGRYEVFNDPLRIDGTDAVCVSIGFPNYKMFWGLRQGNPGVEWVIVVITARALWMEKCAFCQANAASAGVTAIPLADRMFLDAFRLLYEDFEDKQRVVLDIPIHFPTNPQAEVLMLNGVPREYIAGVLVNSLNMMQRIVAAHPEIDVKCFPAYFNGRKDYAHWKVSK